jgi:hypothetical protein
MIKNLFFQNIELSTAEEALKKCLPGSSIMPDRISDAARTLNIEVRFVRIPQWEIQETGVDVYSKLELFDLMFSGVEIPASELIFIPDFILPGKALRYSGGQLREAIARLPHFVFDLDAIFLWPESRRISVFHHGGGFFHVQLPQA